MASIKRAKTQKRKMLKLFGIYLGSDGYLKVVSERGVAGHVSEKNMCVHLAKSKGSARTKHGQAEGRCNGHCRRYRALL